MGTAGFYPQGHVLPADYMQTWAMVMAQRLQAAAQRLAAVLNAANR